MRALVLAGGGSRGSWEAGVLKWMAESTLFHDGFDFVSGTSVGAINAAGIAMFPKAQFREAGLFVEGMWAKHITKTSDVWALRVPFGIPGLWNPSLGKDRLEALLSEVVDIHAIQTSGVKVRFAAVDVEEGKLVLYTGEDLQTHGVKPIIASASYPTAFPPVEIGERWLTDGGVRDTAPLGAAIAAGATDIVVLTTRDPYQVERMPRSELNNTLAFGQRCLSIQLHEVLANDIKWCRQHNKWSSLATVLQKHLPDSIIAEVVEEMGTKQRVNLRVVYPSKPLHRALDFTGEVMVEQIALGYADAERQISA